MNQMVLFCATQCAILWNLWHNYQLPLLHWLKSVHLNPALHYTLRPVSISFSLFNIWDCFAAAALMKSLRSVQGWLCHRASQVNNGTLCWEWALTLSGSECFLNPELLTGKSKRASVAPRMCVHTAGRVISLHVSEMTRITVENKKPTISVTAKP